MLTIAELKQLYPFRPRKGLIPLLILSFILVALGMCGYYITSMNPIAKDLIDKNNGNDSVVQMFCLGGLGLGIAGLALGLFTCLGIGRGRSTCGVISIFLFICAIVFGTFTGVYLGLLNGGDQAKEVLDKMPWLGLVAYYGMAGLGSLSIVLFIVEACLIGTWPTHCEKVSTAIKKMLDCYEDKATKKKMKTRLMVDWKYENYEYVLNDLYYPRIGKQKDNSYMDLDVFEFIVYKQKQDYAVIKETELKILYAAKDFNAIRERYYRASSMTKAKYEYHVGPNSRVAKKDRPLKPVSPNVAKK